MLAIAREESRSHLVNKLPKNSSSLTLGGLVKELSSKSYAMIVTWWACTTNYISFDMHNILLCLVERSRIVSCENIVYILG